MANALETILKNQAYLENSESAEVKTPLGTRGERTPIRPEGQQSEIIYIDQNRQQIQLLSKELIGQQPEKVPVDQNRQQNQRISIVREGQQKREKMSEKMSDTKRLMMLENIAKENMLLQQLIVQSQEVFDKRDISLSDLAALEECLSNWKEQADMTFKSEDEIKREMTKRNKERMERERQRELDELKSAQKDDEQTTEEFRTETKDRPMVNEEKGDDEVVDVWKDNSYDNGDDDKIDVDVEDGKVQEEKEREMEEETRRLKEEEEKRMKEFEENKRREEEKKRQVELQEEEKRMKEFEENKRREEEKKRQVELQEEEKRKRILEEKRIKEEEIKRQIEEERRRKEEEIKKQIEEERRRRLDPMNWSFIVYRVKSDEVGGYRLNNNTCGFGEVSGERDKNSDVCCVISATDGSIRKTDIRCNIVGVDFTVNDNPTMDDERIVSPIVNLQSEWGEMKAEAPIQVFLSHICVNDDINETVLKHSENGEEWISNPPIRPVKFVEELDTRENDNLVGMEINSFTNLRMVLVTRQRRNRISVDEVGGREVVSSDDDDGIIEVIIPKGAFNTKNILETKIQPVPQESVDALLTRGEKVTRVILIYCSQPPTKSLVLVINKQNNDLSKAGNTRYTTIRTGDNWEFADAEFKDNTNSVELPPNRRAYSVIEVDIPHDIPSEQALNVAEAIHTRINSIQVKMILKQNTNDPHNAVIHCVHSNLEEKVLQDIKGDGYSIGPNVSCDIFLQEGTQIEITCFGNVQFINEQKVGLLFFAYMNTANRRVTFEPQNKYFEREYKYYSGGVIYKFLRGSSLDGLTDMMSIFRHPVVLPKGEEECVIQRTVGNLPPEMIGLAKFLSLQMVDNCPDWQFVLTTLRAGSKAITMRTAPQNEDGTEVWGDQEICRRIIVDWMKSKPNFNRLGHIRNVLVSSGYPHLAAPCTDYVNYFKDNMNDAVINKIIDLVRLDPDEVSDRLGLSNDEINNMLIEFHDETLNKTAALIYGWRFTENAIKAGLRAVEVLKKSLGL